MISMEAQYIALCSKILEEGWHAEERTGTGARKIFGAQLRCNMADGFPLLTTKKVWLRAIVVELLWFLQGRVDFQYLHDNKVDIWDEWQLPDGTIGKGYGWQWRSFGKRVTMHGDKLAVEYPGVDQLKNVVERIRTHPQCRRHIVSAWNPVDIPEMALPPCHVLFQFDVTDGKLNLQMYQRSADMFLGVPFNIASYALLLHMVARHTGLIPGEYIHTFGNAHIYDNHVEQMREQIIRMPKQTPTLVMNGWAEAETPGQWDMFKVKPADIQTLNYNPWPALEGKVAV